MSKHFGYKTDYGEGFEGMDQYYHVRIRFTKGVHDIDGRVAELREINEWIKELVEWNPDMYSLGVHSSGRYIDVWFREEKHSLLCKLKWL